jgi:hypothetical protein
MYCIPYPAPTVPALRYELRDFGNSHVSHRLSRSETSVHSTLPTIIMVVHFVSFFEQRDTHPNHSTLRAVPGWFIKRPLDWTTRCIPCLDPYIPKPRAGSRRLKSHGRTVVARNAIPVYTPTFVSTSCLPYQPQGHKTTGLTHLLHRISLAPPRSSSSA